MNESVRIHQILDSGSNKDKISVLESLSQSNDHETINKIISRKTENAGYSIGNIKIGSESLESQDGRMRNVSTIDIEVKRNS